MPSVQRLACALICLALSACAHVSLCELRPTAVQPLSVQTPEQVSTAQWAMLLLRGNGHTCLGEQLLPADAATLRPLLRTSHQLVKDAVAPGQHLVWLQTHGDTGHVYGPVAVVTAQPGRLEVRALGTLMLPRGQVELAVAPMGHGRALWARTQVCRQDAILGRTLCRKRLRVLPWQNDRFIDSPNTPDIDLQRQEVVFLPGGWRRHIEHEADLTQKDDALVLQERLVVRELASRDGRLPARRRRDLQGRRTLTLDDSGHWQTSEPELWQRSLLEEPRPR